MLWFLIPSLSATFKTRRHEHVSRVAEENRMTDTTVDVASAPRKRRRAPPPDKPTYKRTPEAAAHLGLAPSTLDKMRVRGDGPPFIRLTPRSVIYAVDELDAWARARQFNSTSEYSGAAT